MEFCFKSVLGLHVVDKRAFSLICWHDDRLAYLACAGAGVVLVPLEKGTHRSLHNRQMFYYQSPSSAGQNDQPGSVGSPPRSPDLTPLSGGSKLTRVNKSNCTDGSADTGLVVVGEAGGYMPRLLLYDMMSGTLLDSVRDLHQFGIQHLKFSPNGEYLASLGTPQDGYLYVWNVRDRRLTLQASNRCISEIKDLAWISESQFATVGVRIVKVWKLEEGSLLNGRNIVLGGVANQTFESILPLLNSTDSFLVGTSRGSIYSMPSVDLVAQDVHRPIKSMAILTDGHSKTLYTSTSTSVSAFQDFENAAACENGLELSQMYKVGTPALVAHDEMLYFDIGLACVRKLTNEAQVPLCTSEVAPDFFHKKGAQFRASSSPTPTVLSWNSDEKAVMRWPDITYQVPLPDITTADHYVESENPDSTQLLVGSLSGDILLGNRRYNAHNGPVTDVHMLHSHLAVSSARDRCVQVWARGNPRIDSAPESSWYLKQTLLLSTPILKVQLCANEKNEICLVCCGANKTIYIYCSSAQLNLIDESAPIFDESPRSILMKGMPFDAVAFHDKVLVSTNDKMISIINPWSEDKIFASWRPYDANGDSVNLTHLQPLTFAGVNFILGSGSNKSVMIFGLLRGELIASQWGLGEPISGVAWTGKEVLAAGDSFIVSTLKGTETVQTASSILPSPPAVSPSTIERRSRSPPVQSAASPQYNSARITPSTPIRKIYEPKRSRSVSPVREHIHVSPPRSPSPPPRTSTRSPISDRGRVSGVHNSSSSEKQTSGLKPLRLSNPPHAPLTAASPSHTATLLKPQNAILSGDPTKQLEAALHAFVEKPLSHTDTKSLKSLLLAALNKVDGLAMLDELTEKLRSDLCRTVQDQIKESFAKHHNE